MRLRRSGSNPGRERSSRLPPQAPARPPSGFRGQESRVRRTARRRPARRTSIADRPTMRIPADPRNPGAPADSTNPSPQNLMEPKKQTEGTPTGLTRPGTSAGSTNPAAGNPAGRRNCIVRSVDNRRFEQRATKRPTAPAPPAKGSARMRRTEAAQARLALNLASTEPDQEQPDPRRGLAVRSRNPPVPNGTAAAPGGTRIGPKTARSQSPLAPKRTAARRQIRIAVNQARMRKAPNLTPSKPTASRRRLERGRCLRGSGSRPGRFALRGRKAGLRQSPQTQHPQAQSPPSQTSGARTLARRRP